MTDSIDRVSVQIPRVGCIIRSVEFNKTFGMHDDTVWEIFRVELTAAMGENGVTVEMLVITTLIPLDFDGNDISDKLPTQSLPAINLDNHDYIVV